MKRQQRNTRNNINCSVCQRLITFDTIIWQITLRVGQGNMNKLQTRKLPWWNQNQAHAHYRLIVFFCRY